jgi:hypothetical protein
MKKFTVNCDFGGQLSPFTIFIGKPEHAHHPLHFQADWLSKQRGGMIPGDVMEAVTQLQELAEKNGVSLEELCVYALGTPEEQAALEGETTTTTESTGAVEASVEAVSTEEAIPEVPAASEEDAVLEDDNSGESEPK